MLGAPIGFVSDVDAERRVARDLRLRRDIDLLAPHRVDGQRDAHHLSNSLCKRACAVDHLLRGDPAAVGAHRADAVDVSVNPDDFGREQELRRRALGEALTKATPGLFDRRSWNYWLLVLGLDRATPLPARRVP